MNILLITPSYFPAVIYGGPIFSTLNMCNALTDSGHSVKVLTTNAKGGNDKIKSEEIPNLNHNVVYSNDTFLNKFSFSQSYLIIKEFKKYDFIWVQSPFSFNTVLSVLLSRLYNKKIFISPRGSLGEWCLSQGNKFKRHYLNIFFRPFLKNIIWNVTAEAEKQDVLAVFPKYKENFVITPNGNPDQYLIESIDLFTKQELVENMGKESSKYVFSVGRLHPKKGFDLLIDGFAKSTLISRGYSLLIAGEDYGHKSDLDSLINKLGISDSVVLLGNVEGKLKHSLYAHCAFFALPSRHENFGNVYLEAIFYDKPIVTSVNTPWATVEVDGIGICSDLNVYSISQSLEKVDKQLDSYKKIDFERAKNLYTWDSIGKNFTKQCKEFL